jgi:hypothetical protein
VHGLPEGAENGLCKKEADRGTANIRDLAVQSLAQQDMILSEIRALRSPETSGAAAGHTDALGEEMMKSLATTISLKHNGDDDEHQIHLLRQQIHARLVELHNPAAQGTIIQDHKPQAAQLPEARRLHLERDFILSFHFREREYRESAISSPYDSTFAWMLDAEDAARKSTGFRQWLTSASNLFWITGKPGAGKSTLMKYISDFRSQGEGATLCRQLLAEGAGSSQIATASFYFWASGAGIQASQTALFRSLLFDLLQDRADAIPRIAPAAWESACLLGTPFPQDWTEETLRALVVRTVEELSRGDKARVCLFIDGLDEFSGDPQTIIAFVESMLQLPNVKLCVSSRPWVQFQAAFSQASTLRVQDLTYPDIRHFVQTRFDGCPGFRRLTEREAGYAASLIHQVVEKSSGVFLWVRLVVDSLIAGLSNDDRICDLEKRLRSLPPELDDLYARILDDIDPFYFEHACQYFELMLANGGSAEALLLSFADEDRGFFHTLPVAVMSHKEYAARLDTLERRLSSCCKGLLDVSSDRRVNFLHRTARDFLDTPAMRERVGAAIKRAEFDAHLQLCSGFYCLIRATAFGEWGREVFSFASNPERPSLGEDERAVEDSLVGAFHEVAIRATSKNNSNEETKHPYSLRETEDIAVPEWIDQCLHHAARVTAGKHDMIDILDSLSKRLGPVPKLRNLLTKRLARAGSDREDRGWTMSKTCSYVDLLPLATCYGVRDYVRAKIEPGALCWARRLGHKDPSPAFRDRVRRIAVRAFSMRGSAPQKQCLVAMPLLINACLATPPDPEVFKILLDSGADVKFRSGNSPMFWAGPSFHMDLTGCPMLEFIVAVALATSIVVGGPAASARAWSLWLPVLQLLACWHHKLELRLAKSIVGRCRSSISGLYDPRTLLAAEDLLGVLRFDGDGADSSDPRVWKTIKEKIARPKEWS